METNKRNNKTENKKNGISLSRLIQEFKALHTPSKEEVMKTTFGVMVSSAILSLIVFGLSSGTSQIIASFIK